MSGEKLSTQHHHCHQGAGVGVGAGAGAGAGDVIVGDEREQTNCFVLLYWS
jgi:hypothetical protein